MTELFTGNLASREQARALFLYILSEEPVTRPMILNHLKLPPTTLNRALDRLLRDGLIAETGQADSTGGRPASLFQVIPEARLTLGLSIQKQAGQLVLIGMRHQIVAHCDVECSDMADGKPLAEQITTAAIQLLASVPGSADHLLGTGVTVHPDVPSIDAAALLATLENQLPGPSIRTDGLAGAAMLLQEGISANDRIALLSVGSKMTLERSDDDQTGTNDRSSAAIAGFLVPDPLGEESPDLFPVADLVTIPAIGKRFARLRDNKELSFTDFLNALHDGKKKAVRLLNATAESLALVMVNIACTSEKLTFILTGDLPASIPELVDLTAEKAADMSALARVSVQVVHQRYGALLSAAGAAAAILSRILNRPTHIKDDSLS